MFDMIKKIFSKKQMPVVSSEKPVVEKKLSRKDRRNEYYREFFNREIITFANPEDMVKEYLSFNEEDRKFKRYIAVSEDESIVSLHVGFIVDVKINEKTGVLAPVIYDMVSQKTYDNVVKVMIFNVLALTQICLLNKGQFLALFNIAHECIDEEMEIMPELNKSIYDHKNIEILSKLNFYSEVEMSEEKINYIPHIWDDSHVFFYVSPLTDVKKEENHEDRLDLKKADRFIKENKLVLFLSNENDEPQISVLKGVTEFGNTKSLYGMKFDNEKYEENFYWGFPHVFSNTLVSVFEKLNKKMVNAVYFGIEKKDNDNGVMFTTYEKFIQNLERDLKRYHEKMK